MTQEEARIKILSEQTGLDQTLAVNAQQIIEAAADTVLSSNRAYFNWNGERVFHITIANGFIKEEGQSCEGNVASVEELSELAQRFVDKCIELGKGKDVLVWRRFPAVESDDPTFKITARLSWVKMPGGDK